MRDSVYPLHAAMEDRHWWFEARRRIFRRVLQPVLGDRENCVIVDVGCSTGGMIGGLGNLAAKRIGVDPSRAAIELARSRFPQVDFRCGNAPDAVSAEMGEAALVILSDVLEHVEDDRALLGRLVGAAGPGAHFLLTVPADERLWSPHDEAVSHLRRYDLDSFRNLWSDLPLEERLVSYYNARLYPPIRAMRTVARGRGQSAGQLGTDFKVPIAPLNWLLMKVFAGEAEKLASGLDRNSLVYRRGVSIIALLRKPPDLEFPDA